MNTSTQEGNLALASALSSFKEKRPVSGASMTQQQQQRSTDNEAMLAANGLKAPTEECMDWTVDLESCYAHRIAEQAPNEPHPSLEYSFLYHVLKHFPTLLETTRIPYAFRWRLSYPLQHRVTFSRELLKLGVHLTWGELLLLVPFFVATLVGILYVTVFPSVSVSGKVARFPLIAAMVLAQRNSLVTLVLGMPVDRCLFYHKLAGRLAGVTGLLHAVAFFVDPKFRRIYNADPLGGAFTGQINSSGSAMVLLLIGIILSSLPRVRRSCFEAFQYLHVIFVAAMIVGTFYHSGKLFPAVAVLTWGSDLLIRKILMARTRNPQKAQLKIISDTVVQVIFPKTVAFAYNPGQYVYIAIPEISWLQWHPFSISSSPNQDVVTLHIRNAGNWTSALFQLASKKTTIDMLLEGPYGNLAVDLVSDRKYKSVMLISGGIGITPMQSLCDQLVHEKAIGQRELRRIKFVWVERDLSLLQEAVRRTRDVETASTPALSSRTSADLTAQLLALLPPGHSTDEELEAQYADGGFVGESAKESSLEGSIESSLPPFEYDEESATRELPVTNEPVLDLQVYLTGSGTAADSIAFARIGRPNINELFTEMKKEAIVAGERKVAVCVSAPRKLMDLCHKACILYSDDNVRFDFHSESMAV